MPIYGGSPDAVAAYDRFREGLAAQQAQFLPQQALAAVRELEDRRNRQRQYQFALAKQAEDLAFDQERMKLEREKLDETIRANKRAEDFNFKQLEARSAALPATVQAAQSRLDLEKLKNAEEQRQQYIYGRNLSDLLNQYGELPETEANMAAWTPAYEKRAGELDTWLRGEGTARDMALEEMRGQIPYNIPIDVSVDTDAKALAARANAALGNRRSTLESAIDSGMRSGADLIRQDPSGRWYPGVAPYVVPQNAPSTPSRGAMISRANPKAYRFVEQHQAVTNAIDQVQAEMPSFLLAPPELHPQIKEARKQGKDLLRNLSTEKKDLEKQLTDLQKEEEAQAEKAQEQGAKSVDVKKFSFSGARPNPDDVRRQAQAAIARGKDPVAVYRRALELGVDLNQ